MKSKLKKPIDTAKMKVSAYTVKLKTDLAGLAVLPPEERPTPFVLHLNYGFADGYIYSQNGNIRFTPAQVVTPNNYNTTAPLSLALNLPSH